MEIIRLGEDEWQRFRDLRIQAYQNDPLAFGKFVDEIDASETFHRAQLAHDNKVIFFAKVDGELVGTVGLILRKSRQYVRSAVLFGLYVSPEHRGNGVAQNLLEFALRHVRSTGRSKVRLVVTSSQEAAIKLYWKVGFRESGRSKNEILFEDVLYDEVHMECFFED